VKGNDTNCVTNANGRNNLMSFDNEFRVISFLDFEDILAITLLISGPPTP
jgi:hypothetical protein